MSMGDRRYEELVTQHQAAVYAYARAFCGSPVLAEDATQETFLRAWQHLDSFRGDGSAQGWLIRICRNWLINEARRQQRQDRLRDRIGSVRRLESASTASEAESHTELYDAIARLPLVHREAIALCGVLGFDYETAAATLDVPVGTIRSRLNRGRNALRAQLEARSSDQTTGQRAAQ